ncbi:DEAD/DEAH box helicase [Corynebacterium sp. ES2775-CONJ]|uniref:DEAD/DEAH box helicase n=1 Tax=Corynebacterium sp. ES2775-CONJ TaxID=2974029 RepID=UPI002169C36F|nr:DEAD/DEAH box helicase [Corynebacterium sp. ES2775-CONJ]MCS4490324.1 DEAD/DEAH box helicase [Corynebacterium sp. ES2775-CONJ]
MSTLIPVHAAHTVREGITEYLTTSFSLADKNTAARLAEFLTNPVTGMFRGPYVRTRLPYAPAEEETLLSAILPAWFKPYRHQAESFRRLSSIDENGAYRKPEPTLIVTGTGSGKTESFLYPILNHCQHSTARGVKALILYPMNALANDQEARIAELLDGNPALRNVTAGIYVGDSDGRPKKMSKNRLIADRTQLQMNPPDILLTNYKMLDQLLLRSADQPIWERSAATLQYLVLDEFHTYDGAQGTDVALLLRRLELMLQKFRPQDVDIQPTPVATSATMGADADPDAMVDFAHTVFGVTFPQDAVVSETSLTLQQWQKQIAQKFGAPTTSYPVVTAQLIRSINAEIVARQAGGETAYDHDVHAVLCDKLFGCSEDISAALSAYSQHPLVVEVLTHASDSPVPLVARENSAEISLVSSVLEPTLLRILGEEAHIFITHLLSEISFLRAEYGFDHKFEAKQLPGVETHLWVREVSRVERAVGITDGPIFRWYDDGPSDDPHWLPACYCRNCGRSGWMIAKEAGDDQLITQSQKIRSISVEKPQLQRPLIDAEAEALEDVGRDTGDIASVHWLNLSLPSLSRTRPTDEDIETEGIVPVLSYATRDGSDGDLATEQTCPSCGEPDAIRYLGSSVATLLSVALSNYFGQKDLDDEEKKTLIFTDSVQDAAHRAGFVQSRARAFALRTLMRKLVADSEVTLNELPALLMESAKDSPRKRYELIPSEMVDYDAFRAYWDPSRSKGTQLRNAKNAVEQRLAFDIALEFGQRADLARSLTTTGALTVMVDVDDDTLLSVAQQALNKTNLQLPLEGFHDTTLVSWVRGVVEMMRLKGGINHPWFSSYLKEDCNPYQLNKRESLSKGMTAFARGGSPKFPRKGMSISLKDYGDMPLGSPQGFYPRWTTKILGIGSQDSSHLMVALFQALAERDVVSSVRTDTNGEVYALEPQTVVLYAEEEPQFLECSVCHARVGVGGPARRVLEGCPCHNSGCMGSYEIKTIEDNYYRSLYSSTEPRTVVAREHTSLLPTHERLEVENNFKKKVGEVPQAPNVLVATPTLEMGIDIGDLSSVMLASLPKSVASYIQRVGRAGRLTGNSLVISMVRGRTATLPLLSTPLNMIGGTVEPPAAFLGAEEILKRQFIAYLIESNGLPRLVPDLRWGSSVFSLSHNREADTLIAVMEKELTPEIIASSLDAFLGTIADCVTTDVVDELSSWAQDGGLHLLLEQARKDWNRDLELLRERKEAIEKIVRETDKAANSAAADAETRSQDRSAKASLRHLKRQIASMVEEFWISAMERHGLLPNFTLLDDSVDLNVQVSSQNPNTHEFDTHSSEYSRAVSAALFELAPGATFYIQGIAASIDSVEIGKAGEAIEQRRFCPSCSYSELEASEERKSTACPACGEARFADMNQVLNVVQMRKVSAEVERTRSAITDNTEDRRIANFARLSSFIYQPEDVGKSWYLSCGFGVKHIRRLELHMFNLGKGHGDTRVIAGNEVETPLFRVCRYCGHLDSRAGSNSWRDHRRWCQHQKAREEETVSFALARTLKTQGVLISLPSLLSVADKITIPSVTAALLMGFKLLLRGNPHHLHIHEVKLDSNNSGLLLNDAVPGGTGYLTQFSQPEQVRKLLMLAWKRLSTCSCIDTDRKACENCLLPFAAFNADSVSRAAAESALYKLLLNDMHPSDDADPHTVEWKPHTEKPMVQEESKLEAYFLKEFLEQLESKTEFLREKVEGRKRVWEFRFKGNPHVWRMRGQYSKKGTIPDFYLDTDDPSQRDLAVYLDGAMYHIGPQHYRVEDDIRKRRSLKNQEDIISWSITWKDVEEFQKEAKGENRDDPRWFNRGKVGVLGKKFTVDSLKINLLAKDPATQLLNYLQNPDEKLWTTLATIAAAMSISHGCEKDDELLRSTNLGEVTVWWDQSGNHRLELIALDEIDKEAWRNFLHLSNFFFASTKDCYVSVRRESEVEALLEEKIDAIPIAEPESGIWADVFNEFAGEDELIKSLKLLEHHGAPLPTSYGEELDGIPTVALWQEEKVALLYPEDAELIEDITGRGWYAVLAKPKDTLAEVFNNGMARS